MKKCEFYFVPSPIDRINAEHSFVALHMESGDKVPRFPGHAFVINARMLNGSGIVILCEEDLSNSDSGNS